MVTQASRGAPVSKIAFGHTVEVSTSARHAARLDDLVHEQIRHAVTARMKQRNLSGRALASSANLNASTVGDFLAGRSRLSLGRIVAVAVALDVTIDQLLGASAAATLVEESLAG